jgi:elongation factor 1-gamma
VLDTPQGPLFGSNAIARYVARLRSDTELLGATFYDKAQVDTWIEFCAHDIEPPTIAWYSHYSEATSYNQALIDKARDDLQKSLAVLEAHLVDKTYVVGHKVTLADIALVCALLFPFKFASESSYHSVYPNVERWFTTCANQLQFEKVIGTDVRREQGPAPSADWLAQDNDSVNNLSAQTPQCRYAV